MDRWLIRGTGIEGAYQVNVLLTRAAADGPRYREEPARPWPYPWISLLAQVASGDRVLVTTLDRLGQSIPEIATNLLELSRRKVDLYVHSGAFRGTHQHPMLYTIARCAQGLLEVDRVLGEEAADAGDPTRRKHKGGRRRLLSQQQAVMAETLREQGESVAKLARRMKVSPSTISRELERQSKRSRRTFGHP